VPALEQPEGLARVLGMSDAYLSYLERRVFPGWLLLRGSRAEFAIREGRVRQKLQEFAAEGMRALAETIRKAQAQGEIDPEADADQLAFEIDALCTGRTRGSCCRATASRSSGHVERSATVSGSAERNGVRDRRRLARGRLGNTLLHDDARSARRHDVTCCVRGRSGLRDAARSRTRRSTSRSTTFISTWANEAPMQRRTPPPNGIHA
jgi:hypothetical protein